MIRALLDGLRTRWSPASAGEWFARTQTGSLTAAEKRDFDAWLAARPENREELERSVRLAEVGDRMKARPDLVTQMPAYAALRQGAALPRRSDVGGTRVLRWSLSAALAVGACVAVVLLIVPRMGAEELPTLVATKHGERRQLPLEDGTRVHLNTDSSIGIAFSDRERRVVLTRGEGFFDVTKDSAGRPFIVEVGSTEVRVVGTRFSVRVTETGADVIVSEGKVEVVPDTHRHSPSIPTKVELAPGNALRFDRRENEVRIAAVDPERATAWRSGTIDVDNATVEELIAEVNRYARTPFVIADDRIRSIRLSGSFKVGDVESVRFVLRDGFGIEARSEGERIVLR